MWRIYSGLGIIALTVMGLSRSFRPRHIKIGVILHADQDFADFSSLVGYVANWTNSDEGVLNGTRLEPLVRAVSPGNSYMAMETACELSQSQIAALVSFGDCRTTTEIQPVAERVGLPYIYLSRDFCPLQRRQYSLSLAPDKLLYDRALLDLLAYEHWDSMVVFYDETYNFERLQLLTNAATDNNWELLLFPVRDTERVEASLRQIDKQEYNLNNIIVICDVTTTILIMKTAALLKMTGRKYQWIIVNEVISDADLGRLNASHGVISVIRQDLQWVPEIYRDLITWQEEHARRKDSPLQASHGYFYDALHALVRVFEKIIDLGLWEEPEVSDCRRTSQSWISGPEIVDYIKTMAIMGSLGTPVFENGNNIKTQLAVLALESRRQGKQFVQIGNWRPSTGLNTSRALFISPTEGFMNRTFRVVTIEDEPFIMKTVAGNRTIWSGFLIDLLQKMASDLNFAYEIYEDPDKAYGIKTNGQWSGIIKQLSTREADMAFSAMTITSEREEEVDFTKPFMDYSVDVLMKKPELRKNEDVFAFLQPFEIRVWGAVFGAIFVVGVSLHLLNRFSSYGSYNYHIGDSKGHEFNMGNSLWFAFGTFMQQGSDSNPRSVSSRTLSVFWWFFTIIMISTYTANLAAHLTVTRMEKPISSIDDLAKQTEIKYGTVLDSSLYSFFKNAEAGTYERMFNFMNSTEPSPFVATPPDGIARVRASDEEQYYFLYDTAVLKYAHMKFCDVITIDNPFNARGYGIALQQDFPYQNELSVEILKLQESGELERMQLKWWQHNKDCDVEKAPDVAGSRLTIHKLAGVFYTLGVGVALSCMAVLMDILWDKIKNWLLSFRLVRNIVAFYKRKKNKRSFTSRIKKSLRIRSPSDMRTDHRKQYGGCEKMNNSKQALRSGIEDHTECVDLETL